MNGSLLPPFREKGVALHWLIKESINKIWSQSQPIAWWHGTVIIPTNPVLWTYNFFLWMKPLSVQLAVTLSLTFSMSLEDVQMLVCVSVYISLNLPCYIFHFNIGLSIWVMLNSKNKHSILIHLNTAILWFPFGANIVEFIHTSLGKIFYMPGYNATYAILHCS